MNGVLFLVVGNSATGKDSIINYVLSKTDKVNRVKRHISRRSNLGEDSVYIDESGFDPKDYFLSWNSYSKHYGIPIEVYTGLKEGKNFIVNVSRDVVDIARQRWSKTFVIECIAPIEVIVERLRKRGRENGDEIKKRVARAKNSPRIDANLVVDTSNPDVSVAGNKVLSFILSVLES